MSKATRPAVAAAALLLAGAAQARSLPIVDHIVVDKSARTMTLYSRGRAVRVIPRIQLGDAPVGPKRFAGDERTPEGRYTIDSGNEASNYYLSLHISYPNASDRAYAAAHGRSAGGQIFIHGQPNDLPGADRGARMRGDWTDGCIAVSNPEIAALWQVVPDGAVIDIVP